MSKCIHLIFECQVSGTSMRRSASFDRFAAASSELYGLQPLSCASSSPYRSH